MLPFSIISNRNILPQRTKIVKMETGTDHIALLYDNGELYTKGNGGSGRLGTGNSTSNYATWSLVQTDVKDVWCGNSFTIILKSDNTFWFVGGNNPFGSTGFVITWTERTSFFNSAGVLGSDIKDIQLGANCMYVLSSDGSLYISGRNLAGELGTGNTVGLTVLTLKDTNVQKISYCAEFAAYIKDGLLYRSGYGQNNQRGDGSQSNLTTSTVLSNPSGYELVDVSVSSANVYYLYREISTGVVSLYVNGSNTVGELGLGHSNTVSERTKVNGYDNLILDIKSHYTANHKLIYTTSGVYAAGRNAGGQCGIGITGNNYVFTPCIGLPSLQPQFMLPFFNSGTYVAVNDEIFWCGTASNMIGGTGNQLSFIKMVTPYN